MPERKHSMKISTEKPPRILLLGNGINRAYDFTSWDGLIESLRTKELSEEEKRAVKKVPYPLQPVIMTDDQIDQQMKEIADELSEQKASEEEETLLRRYASLPMDAILTTNYTYEIEKALILKFRCVPRRRCKWRRLAYGKAGEQAGDYEKRQFHTYFSAEGYAPSIWHIHGEAARPDTMILGHYYYGKLLAKMQKNSSNIIARYKGCRKRKQAMDIRSWLEYFLIGDVYIVGCGLVLSEMDLWWLINCKKRNFPESKVVLYKPDLTLEERMLADAYGVRIKDGGFTGDYKEYYEKICENLENL
jgi:hypothetical protein